MMWGCGRLLPGKWGCSWVEWVWEGLEISLLGTEEFECRNQTQVGLTSVMAGETHQPSSAQDLFCVFQVWVCLVTSGQVSSSGGWTLCQLSVLAHPTPECSQGGCQGLCLLQAVSPSESEGNKDIIFCHIAGSLQQSERQRCVSGIFLKICWGYRCESLVVSDPVLLGALEKG